MTRASFLYALLAALVITRTHPALAQQAPLPASVVGLDSPDGRRLLVGSDANTDFFSLANQWVSQQHGAYCGVASSVMVLNAMQLAAPPVAAWSPYNAFTQDNIFDAATRHVIGPESVSHGGMTLDQLGQFLAAHGVQTQVVHADEATLDQFRRQIGDNLREPGNYVIVNYDRAGVGQESMGHISPIGAYSSSTDRFLVMDVARYKYPGVWVGAVDLWRAIHTQDPVSGRLRGYVLVSYAPGAHPIVGPPVRTRIPPFVIGVLSGTFAAGASVGAIVAVIVMRRRRRAQ